MGAESSIAAQPCVHVVLLCGSRSDFGGTVQLDQIPFMGCPAFPFIGQGKVWVTAEEKEKNEREKKAARTAGSLSFMWVLTIL